jgi:hypothetical protein
MKLGLKVYVYLRNTSKLASAMPPKRVSKAKWNTMSAAAKAKLKAALARGGYVARPRKSTRTAPIRRRTTPKYSVPRTPGSVFAKGMGMRHSRKGVGYQGDYTVKSNSIIHNTSPAAFATKGRGVIIRHREYVQDIITSSSAGVFSINTFGINPIIGTTFPWLAYIAQNFEKYCIRGMTFRFVSTSGDALNSVNTALGTVIMSTQYSSYAIPFSTKQQMENHEFSSSGKSSCDMLHAIECQRDESPLVVLYTGSGDETSVSADVRLTNFAKFSIATVGFQGTSVNIGELHIDYDIELLVPLLQPSGDGPDGSVPAPSHFVSPAVAVGGAFQPYMGTAPVLVSGGIPCVFLNTAYAYDTIQFPYDATTGRQYLFDWTNWGLPPEDVFAVGGIINNATLVNWYYDETSGYNQTIPGAGDTMQCFKICLFVPAGTANATIVMNNGTLMATDGGWVDIMVTQVPTGPEFKDMKAHTLKTPFGGGKKSAMSHVDFKELKARKLLAEKKSSKSPFDRKKASRALRKAADEDEKSSPVDPDGTTEEDSEEDEDMDEAIATYLKKRYAEKKAKTAAAAGHDSTPRLPGAAAAGVGDSGSKPVVLVSPSSGAQGAGDAAVLVKKPSKKGS